MPNSTRMGLRVVDDGRIEVTINVNPGVLAIWVAGLLSAPEVDDGMRASLERMQDFVTEAVVTDDTVAEAVAEVEQSIEAAEAQDRQDARDKVSMGRG